MIFLYYALMTFMAALGEGRVLPPDPGGDLDTECGNGGSLCFVATGGFLVSKGATYGNRLFGVCGIVGNGRLIAFLGDKINGKVGKKRISLFPVCGEAHRSWSRS